MPSILHEALIEIFHQCPSFAATLLSDVLRVPVPDWRRARLDSGDLTDLPHTEYRADAVVALCRTDDPALAVVIEIQLGRDTGKRWSWPVYLATLRARLKCPVLLLVVCTDAATAAWCANPIELGHPNWVLRPLVIGPAEIPKITGADDPPATAELAVLSALAHAGDPDGTRVMDAMTAALDTIDPDYAVRYIEIVLAALPEAARRYLEAKMSSQTFKFRSDYARRMGAEYVIKGEVEMLFEVLGVRGFDVPDDLRHRITECSDPEQLKAWVRRAVTAGSVQEVFD